MAQIRGVFQLPFTSPQNIGVPNVVTLPSGGVWYPPSGTYLITTGSQTMVGGTRKPEPTCVTVGAGTVPPTTT